MTPCVGDTLGERMRPTNARLLSREQFENSNAQTRGRTEYYDAPEHRTKQLD
jgi:hypothetical protein